MPPHTPEALEAVRLYPVAKAADLISMSRTWVYEQIKEGRLPVVEFGSTRAKQRIRADDLQKFIDARTHPRTTEPN